MQYYYYCYYMQYYNNIISTIYQPHYKGNVLVETKTVTCGIPVVVP